VSKASGQQKNESGLRTHFHVVIIGAGLGGLCLAQALKKAGISVAVYERDHTCSERLQGYRIHIDPRGSKALHDCLPSHLYDTFLATCGKGGDGIGFYDEQLRELLFLDPLALEGNAKGKSSRVEQHKSVSRITLRQILLAGLEEIVHFDKAFTHYERTPDGKITAFFEDGTAVAGDVLVAADGGNSRVRKQFLPSAQRVETGVMGIMGKVPLTEETRAWLQRDILDSFSLIIMGPNGGSLFIAKQEFRHHPTSLPGIIGGNDEEAAALNPDFLFDNTRDYIFVAVIAPLEKFALSRNPEQIDEQSLQSVACRMVRNWHPTLQRLVSEMDSSTLTYKPLLTSLPLKHWETQQITLVGDAIHSMTPMRGMGGNTAFRDASLLSRNLIAASRGEKSLLEAIQEYEIEMLKYGFAAVQVSKQTLTIVSSENVFGRMILKMLLRSINAVFSLRRKAFSRRTA
jgi:salicylate hydroxylase